MNVLVSLFNSLPGAAGQGLIWGIMAIGVYITYKILDVADLTVDGSLATGGAVAALCVSMGWNPWLAVLAAVLAGMLAGLATGVLHTACGIPAILAGILTQLALYSINLRIMAIGDENATTKATLAVSVDKNDLLLSSRYVREPALNNPLLLLVLLTAAVIALLYWFFGTEQGSALRATGANQSMARAQGINTNTAKVLGLVVSNGLVALAGGLLAPYRPQAALRGDRRDHLLCGHHRGAPPGPGVHRSEAAHRPGGGGVPGSPLLEGPLFHQARAEGGRSPCLKCAKFIRPSTPAPSTRSGL